MHALATPPPPAPVLSHTQNRLNSELKWTEPCFGASQPNKMGWTPSSLWMAWAVTHHYFEQMEQIYLLFLIFKNLFRICFGCCGYYFSKQNRNVPALKKTHNKLVSNWMLMSYQPHRVTSGWSNSVRCKCTCNFKTLLIIWTLFS